ncbi:hypothetical protein IFM89_015038 [Coptis chinensis]|uniref:Reverse transcriptase zinc-binding domain-containing protein n=1 Tax=Coptis chinensis TaxID=261450 RepID=A0A835HN25_9MAGN|nr:hypothetical protein IFM89_015038 [Coptis chinensis]
MTWNSGVPPKVQFFFWCLLQGNFLTTDQQHARGKAVAAECVLCTQVDETADHLMLHGSFSKEVWQTILHPVGIDINQAIRPHSVASCLHSWLLNSTVYGKYIGLLVPYATGWSMWKTRNDAIDSPLLPFHSIPLIDGISDWFILLAHEDRHRRKRCEGERLASESLVPGIDAAASGSGAIDVHSPGTLDGNKRNPGYSWC